jgi:hypothetical protein
VTSVLAVLPMPTLELEVLWVCRIGSRVSLVAKGNLSGRALPETSVPAVASRKRIEGSILGMGGPGERLRNGALVPEIVGADQELIM